jgi:hypothetical protein
MFSIEAIAGERMVEILLATLPVDKLEILPLMFHVAEFALLVIGVYMKSRSASYPFSKKGVTGQAFFGGNLFFEAMALIAIFQTLQVGMDL